MYIEDSNAYITASLLAFYNIDPCPLLADTVSNALIIQERSADRSLSR